MAAPKDIIAEAFIKLESSISKEDAHTFASTRLEDVWAAVKEIDVAQRARRSAQNLRRIEPFLRGVEQYSKVIEVLCNGTPYMPYVWAPIKLMIQIASHHRDIFDALLTAYADIGAALPRFDRYEQAFNGNKDFQNVLATVYSTILEFHQQAYKFFKKRAWHLLFLSLWKDFKARFSEILETLKKQRDFIDREATSIDLLESKEHRSRLGAFQEDMRKQQIYSKRLLDQNEQNTKISQLQHAIGWLSGDDQAQESEYERLSYQRHEKTCEWVVSEKLAKSWLSFDKKESLLWLNGKPGAGKSVMCSFFISKLEDTPGMSTCYYFCKNNDANNVCDQILKTIATQLLRGHLDLASLIANKYVYQGLACGMNQLRELIPQLLEILPNSRIIIDGIDECKLDNQKIILKEVQALCTRSNTNCKILFSSRREVHIRDKLAKKPQICLDGRHETELDIRTYAKYQIHQLQSTDEGLLEKIESILVEKANGMFLWVRLVVDELGYCFSDADLEERAVGLPKGLEAAYGRILDRISSTGNSNYQLMAIRILEWMACAFRPLRSYEILDGIAFRPGSTILNSKTKMRKEILDLCRPLIEDGLGGTIDFVHFSAKEFILKEEYGGSKTFIEASNAHLNMSFSCVAYLNHALFMLPAYSTDIDRASVIVQGLHGLQLYATRFWYKHLLEHLAALSNRQRSTLTNEFLVQLELLIRYRKPEQVTATAVNLAIIFSQNELIGIRRLESFPSLREFIVDTARFRATPTRDNTSDNSPADVYLGSVHADPTQFTSVGYQYQRTTEALLSEQALQHFPQIDTKQLQIFLTIYGESAYLCRYIDCPQSADGFSSSKERERHEARHQCKFRCGYSDCLSFAAGFITRSQLNKHNEKWHTIDLKGVSLVEAIRVLTLDNREVIGRSSPHSISSNASQAALSARNWPQTAVLQDFDFDSFLHPDHNEVSVVLQELFSFEVPMHRNLLVTADDLAKYNTLEQKFSALMETHMLDEKSWQIQQLQLAMTRSLRMVGLAQGMQKVAQHQGFFPSIDDICISIFEVEINIFENEPANDYEFIMDRKFRGVKEAVTKMHQSMMLAQQRSRHVTEKEAQHLNNFIDGLPDETPRPSGLYTPSTLPDKDNALDEPSVANQPTPSLLQDPALYSSSLQGDVDGPSNPPPLISDGWSIQWDSVLSVLT